MTAPSLPPQPVGDEKRILAWSCLTPDASSEISMLIYLTDRTFAVGSNCGNL